MFLELRERLLSLFEFAVRANQENSGNRSTNKQYYTDEEGTTHYLH